MVQGNNKAGNAWFDIRGIQNQGTVDCGLRNAIMNEARAGLRLLSPIDKVQLGLGMSSVAGVDMSGDSGEILVQLQDQNQNLQAHNNQLTQRVADLTATNDTLRAQNAGGNP